MAKLPKNQTPVINIEPTVLNVVTESKEIAEEKVEVVVQASAKGEKLVKIKPNATFRIYIGNRYHNFVKGEVVQVTENVKDVLMRQGALGAI